MMAASWARAGLLLRLRPGPARVVGRGECGAPADPPPLTAPRRPLGAVRVCPRVCACRGARVFPCVCVQAPPRASPPVPASLPLSPKGARPAPLLPGAL